MPPLDGHQLAAYLRRIDVATPDQPDLAALARLQLSHLLCVPFENLDIHRGVPIVLEPTAIFDKVVRRNRGGYCYELNSAFAALLLTLGYGVDMVAARVATDHGGFGRDLAHLTLVVRVPGTTIPYLVDVGFGDAFTKPLPLVPEATITDRDREVRLIPTGGEWAYQEDRGGGWQVRYAFTTQARTLEQFGEMNEWQQTAPESHFTTSTICSLLTIEGRLTLSDTRMITTRHGERLEVVLSQGEVNSVLEQEFGIVLEQPT
jgi:N-hydroxyarylamine O-acetyltransferase